MLPSVCTVSPYVPKNSLQKPSSFPIYRESPKKLYIPRFFGFDNYGEPDESRIPDGTSVNINFNGSLRDYQQNVVNTYVSKIGPMGGGGLLELPCGYGKTIIALNIIATLKLKTIVIVHKSFLMNQWIERINQFLPESKIGIIQQKKFDLVMLPPVFYLFGFFLYLAWDFDRRMSPVIIEEKKRIFLVFATYH